MSKGELVAILISYGNIDMVTNNNPLAQSRAISRRDLVINKCCNR
jgi:hypothetical protein